ncbi:MAG: hypothetical protein WB780_20350 [Candidatus Acidiferrales bacterium]
MHHLIGNPVVAKVASILIPGRFLPMETRLELRRQMARDKQAYTVLGRMHTIVFDPAGMNLPDLDYPVLNQNVIQWLDEPFPRIAVTKDEQDVLILDSVPHPHDVNHPTDRVATDLESYQVFGGTRPALMPQRYRDRTVEEMGRFLVIRPIYQILFYALGLKEAKFLMPGVGPDGSRMAFLIDPKTKEGHLVGGQISVDSRIHQSEYAA